MPAIGDAILIPSGPQGHHLFIILNDPKPIPGYGTADHCVMVNVSTIDPALPHDGTCVLASGSHPFIVAHSYVYYKGVRVDRADHIDNCVTRGSFINRPPPFPLHIVTTVKQGLAVSPRVSRAFKTLLI